ncbi:hypothetical protein Acsp03_24070 [Actinomadura sp. NBRC 104412]|nr:hypothetical protein Acsp03_24070 [Actinomadura sp. NBRC 104412]
MAVLGSLGVTMTARVDTTGSGADDCPFPACAVADGPEEPGEPDGACVPGPSPWPGEADDEDPGAGTGGAAPAAPDAATAEMHVAANAAPQTRTLRTPGPFSSDTRRAIS